MARDIKALINVLEACAAQAPSLSAQFELLRWVYLPRPQDARYEAMAIPGAQCSFTCHVRRLLVSDSCLTHAPRGCRKYSYALRPRPYNWRRLCIGRATQRGWAAGGSEVLSPYRCLGWLPPSFCLSPVSVDLITRCIAVTRM